MASLRKGHLEIEMESILRRAQYNRIKRKYIKTKINKTRQNSKFTFATFPQGNSHEEKQ